MSPFPSPEDLIRQAADICRKAIAHLKRHPNQAAVHHGHALALAQLGLLDEDADAGTPWDIWESSLELLELPDASASPDILRVARHIIREGAADRAAAVVASVGPLN